MKYVIIILIAFSTLTSFGQKYPRLEGEMPVLYKEHIPATANCPTWPVCFYDCMRIDKQWKNVDEFTWWFNNAVLCKNHIIAWSYPSVNVLGNKTIHVKAETMAEVLCQVKMLYGLEFIVVDKPHLLLIAIKRKDYGKGEKKK
jgi:hypothetical protein